MSATNSTANYELPIFLATDKPAWLTDWNGAMSAIDTAIHSAQSTADGAQTTAGTAIADIATINASLTTITGNITSLTTTVNGNTGAINTINSLIGNGQPTTEDKTLIGAINEIYGMITGGGDPVEAVNVAYDNTTSRLTATDVQTAIDEVYASIPVGPTPGSYNFDLTKYQDDCTITPATGFDIEADLNDVKYALNDDKSIGKIYGAVQVAGKSGAVALSQGWNKIATITGTNLPTRASEYAIVIGCVNLYRTGWDGVANARLKFKTDGSIDVEIYERSAENVSAIAVSIPPCIYMLSQGL